MPGIFSAAELADLQDLAVSVMPDTAQVQRPTVTDDGAGGSTAAYAAVGGPVPCLLGARNLTASEAPTAGRLGITTLWDVQVPAGTDVRAADRLSISGRTFEVVSLLTGSYPVAVQLTAAEVL